MTTHAAPQPALSIRAPAPAAPGAAIFAFSLLAYAAFLAAILYAIGFVGGWLVPKGIDDGPLLPAWQAVLANTLVLMLFVLQHTVMARPAFKRWVTRIIPAAAERSVFVLAASLCLGLAFWLWRPLPQVVWTAAHPAARAGLSALCLLGWGLVFYSSFLINHFDLFGLRQGWLALRRRAYTPVGFRLANLYRFVRHPLMLGFLIAVWSAPTMSLGRLLFALLITGYILFGTHMEERDLVAEHGEDYRRYRRKVPRFIPSPFRRTLKGAAH